MQTTWQVYYTVTMQFSGLAYLKGISDLQVAWILSNTADMVAITKSNTQNKILFTVYENC